MVSVDRSVIIFIYVVILAVPLLTACSSYFHVLALASSSITCHKPRAMTPRLIVLTLISIVIVD